MNHCTKCPACSRKHGGQVNMGYTTEFEGAFSLDRPLAPHHLAYLRAFCYVRHMRRDTSKLLGRPDFLREAVGLPVGREGEFCVFSHGYGHYGHQRDDTIVEYNDPPVTQPGLWCNWIPNETGTAIQWNGGEKFYDYVEWLEYLIKNFLAPWGYTLTGIVSYDGEDERDKGRIDVSQNMVKLLREG